MRKYLSKNYQRAKLNLQNFKSRAIIRISNLAKRLDQGHSRDEKKK
jgi:hypothetical protein